MPTVDGNFAAERAGRGLERDGWCRRRRRSRRQCRWWAGAGAARGAERALEAVDDRLWRFAAGRAPRLAFGPVAGLGARVEAFQGCLLDDHVDQALDLRQLFTLLAR